LIALKAYEQGKAGAPEPRFAFMRSDDSKNKRPKAESPLIWIVHKEISKALDKAFYASFRVICFTYYTVSSFTFSISTRKYFY